MSTLAGIGKDELARVVAADIAPGSFVNLGIGLPTRISNHLPVFLIQPDGVVGSDLFGIDFTELTALLGIPLVDGTTAS